jgi:hypothetical protein
MYADAAQLLASCMLGRDQFIASNSLHGADQSDLRVEHALIAGESADAKLILLAMHSGVIDPSVAERFVVKGG